MNSPFNCLVVLGPTASGKTRIAVQLAGHFNGEIISADSRQVYRGLDIGTGKDLHEYALKEKNIPYHLIDIADPAEQFYLHHFTDALRKSFDDISARGRLPVICGGTGLYLDALRKDFSLTRVPEDEALRNELEALDKKELLQRLSNYPPKNVAQVDKTSVKRIIRGIEVAEFLSANAVPQPQQLPYSPYYLGLIPPAETIAANIRARLEKRFGEGMVEEVERLLAHGVSHERLQQFGLEYKFISRYLQKQISYEEMKELLFTAIRQYSKRQMTWFRKMEKEGVKIHWLTAPFVTERLLKDLETILGRGKGNG